MKRTIVGLTLFIAGLLAGQSTVTGYQVSCPPYPDCLECACVSPTPTPTTPGAGITIAHISDMHAGKYSTWTYRSRVVVGVVGKADALVDTGDCTENGQYRDWKDYMDVMKESPIPWLAVPGNHDTTWTLGKPEWFWDVGDYRLVGINTRILDWEFIDMALNTERLVVLFAHQPLEEFPQPWQLKKRLRLDNVIAFVSGHDHTDGLTYFEDVAMISGGRVSIGSYRMIHLDGRNVTVEFLNPWS